MKVRILSDDWPTFGTIATVVDEYPREGSSMMWVKLDDGTLVAISRHECEEVEG
jgi:hypothetical protein